MHHIFIYSAISSESCNERSTLPCELLALASQCTSTIWSTSRVYIILANSCMIAQENISII